MFCNGHQILDTGIDARKIVQQAFEVKTQVAHMLCICNASIYNVRLIYSLQEEKLQIYHIFFFNRKRVTLLFLRPQLTINLLRYNINTPKKLKRSNIERGKELLQMNDEVEQWKTDIKVYSKKRSSTRLRGTPRMGPIAGQCCKLVLPTGLNYGVAVQLATHK